MKKTSHLLGIVWITILVGCNLPQGQVTKLPSIAYTAAAMTVEAALTHVAETNAQTQTPFATPTPVILPMTISTNTLVPTNTNIPKPCNAIKFIDDVSYPDRGPGTGPNLIPGTHFTKIWRLQNNGTCTWDSSYHLYFISGNAMNGPAAQTLTGTVAPMQTIDVSVELIAPTVVGTYTGYWKLQDPNGVVFGYADNKAFWVTINVVTGKSTITLSPVASESGSVHKDGTVISDLNVGDTADDIGMQALISFDIRTIPLSATIVEVKLDLRNFALSGNPFQALGCLRAYRHAYSTLGPGIYFSGAPAVGADHLWCSEADFSNIEADSDYKDSLVAARSAAHNRLQFRLQFTNQNNGNGSEDAVLFSKIYLSITIKVP